MVHGLGVMKRLNEEACGNLVREKADPNACEAAMHERFTDRARKVMQRASQEAIRFNHEYIGTEHILLGLVRDGGGVAASVMENMGFDQRIIRLGVERWLQSGPEMVVGGDLPHTPRAKHVVEFAMEEARHLNCNHVGTEHLLLGLLREEDGIASQVLTGMGMRIENVREVIVGIVVGSIDIRNFPQWYVIAMHLLSDEIKRNIETKNDDYGGQLMAAIALLDATITNRNAEIAKLRESFEPIADWYGIDQEEGAVSFPDALREAVADFQKDRKENIKRSESKKEHPPGMEVQSHEAVPGWYRDLRASRPMWCAGMPTTPFGKGVEFIGKTTDGMEVVYRSNGYWVTHLPDCTGFDWVEEERCDEKQETKPNDNKPDGDVVMTQADASDLWEAVESLNEDCSKDNNDEVITTVAEILTDSGFEYEALSTQPCASEFDERSVLKPRWFHGADAPLQCISDRTNHGHLRTWFYVREKRCRDIACNSGSFPQNPISAPEITQAEAFDLLSVWPEGLAEAKRMCGVEDDALVPIDECQLPTGETPKPASIEPTLGSVWRHQSTGRECTVIQDDCGFAAQYKDGGLALGHAESAADVFLPFQSGYEFVRAAEGTVTNQ